jgi:hypothetical protein
VLLTGSIGANPIVMELRICGEMVGGRYYYRRNSESLMLFGSIKGDPNTVTRTIELREFGADGQLFKPNNATLTGRVSLDPVSIDAESSKWQRDGRVLPWKANENTTGETYSSLRRVFGPIQKATDGSFSYRTVKHTWEYCVAQPEGVPPPGSMELFPGASRGAPEDCCGARRAIVDATWLELLDARAGLDVAATNRTLTTLLDDYAPSAADAAGGSTSLRVVAARGRVLSFILKTDGVYRGAYPDHHEYGVTVDLRDGRRMGMTDLLDVGDRAKSTALLAKRVPLWPVGGGEACDWLEDAEPYVHIADDGLHLTPYFPHVAKACQYKNLGRLLPRELAVRYARPGSLLSDVLAGRWSP